MNNSEDEQFNFLEKLEAVNQCLERATSFSCSPDDAVASLTLGQDMVVRLAEGVKTTSLVDRDMILAVLEEVHGSLGASRDLIKAAQAGDDVPDTDTSLDSSSTMRASQSPRTPSCPSDVGSAGNSGQDSEATASIEGMRRPVGADMALSSVAGMAQAKQLLNEAVVLPIRYRHWFTGARKPWRSVLLYGPPGTGKTRLALAVAAEVGAELYAISPADLLSSWFGRTERNIRELFEQLHARARSQCVIVFLDEVDGLCRRRSHEETESTRRMKTELLTQLQEQGQQGQQAGDGQLFFVCATNCPWEIDPAFLRRFQRRIFIGLPDRVSRQEMVRIMVRDSSAAGAAVGWAATGASVAELGLQADEWRLLLDRTEGFSGSDLADLVRNAMYQPIRETTSARHWVLSDSSAGKVWLPCASNTVGAVRRNLQDFPPQSVGLRNVTMQDFIEVMGNARPTVCPEELARYDQFTALFGQIG